MTNFWGWKMKHLKVSSLSSFIKTVSLFLTFSLTLFSQNFPIEKISIEQINYLEPFEIENSPSARVTINYDLPLEQSRHVLNIVAKSNLPGVADVWWGQNFILNPFPEPVSLNCVLDLHPVGGLAGQNIEEIIIAFVLTEELLLSMPQIPLEEFVVYQLTDYNYAVGSGVKTATEIDTIEVTPYTPAWSPETDPTWIYRGCEVPNIDLDNSTYPFNMDNAGNILYQGDLNACAQAALANSFAWLESQHPEINTGLNTRQMVQQLDEAVNRDFASGAPAMEGVIGGALDFIDSNQIPVSVKFQSLGLNTDINSPNFDYGHSAQNAGTNPQNPNTNQVSWDWIKSEMEAGEDVTLVYSNWDGTAWTTSHAVALTGISKDANNMKLTYKDDSGQLNPGGTSETQVDVQFINGWLVTNQLSGGPGSQIITAVVSKSYDPSVTFPPASAGEGLPNNLQLKQNYPNPFNPITQIEYSTPEDGFANLKIYNFLGELIAVLTNQFMLKGQYSIIWDGEKYSSGFYLCRLEFNGQAKTIKMVLIK